jgi:hypothetical protein
VSSIIRHKFKEVIREDKFDYVMNKMNEAGNFFKHANRDAGKSLKFNPKLSEIWIWDSCLMYQQFSGEMTDYMQCYHLWYMLHNREAMAEPVKTKLKESDSLLNYPKQEFLKVFIEALQQRLY